MEESESGSSFYAMKEYAKRFYKSKAWQRTRAAYARSQSYLCERCRARGLIVPGEIVHHKIYLTPENIRQPEISLAFENLELLCRECHANEHEDRPERRFTVDEYGRVTALQ